MSLSAGEAKALLTRLTALPDPPPIMLWGAGGVGKSSVVKQVCQERGWGFIDVRLLLLNPVDLRGLPVPNREIRRAEWYIPAFLPDVLRDGPEGIILYDEITSAPPAVQAACYQILLDRRLGEYVLPPGWRQVAAGNRAQDRGVTNRMPAPLANRLIHIEVEPVFDDWKTWALASGEIDYRVVAFLNFRPELLYKFPDSAAEIRAYPTPRSWHFVSRVLPAFGSADDAYQAIAGCVGEGAATEFTAFCRLMDQLPDVQAILNGAQVAVPDRLDLLYALVSALVSVLRTVSNHQRLANAFRYVTKMPIEFQTLFVLDLRAVGLQGQLAALPEFRSWAKDNTDVFAYGVGAQVGRGGW